MRHSFFFPINVSLEGKNCLIYGLGDVGKRKLNSLLRAKAASVLILDLLPKEALQLEENIFSSSGTKLSFRQGSFTEEDLKNIFMVFACSSDKLKNQALCSLCQKKNILCDNSSDPEEGNFISPACIEAAPLILSLSTGGMSPLLAARLKRELQEWLKPKALLAELIGKLRPYIINLDLPQKRRREIFLSILDSPIPNWLLQGQFELCEQWLLDKLSFLAKNDLQKIFRELKCSHPI